MTIETLLQEDLEQVSALTPEGWGDLALHFDYNLQSSFCVPLKAVIGDTLAGLGNIIYNEDSAWLSQIVVHPGFRNQGIGKAITAALIDHIDRNRYPTIMLDATDMGYPVYRSLGFATISRHVHLSGELLATAPMPAALIPYEEQYLDQVLLLDRQATGEDRAGTLLEQIDKALLYREGDQITGAYWPALSRGPVIAAGTNAGLGLLQVRMQEKTHSMLPEENRQAIGWLQQQGFREQRKSRRMRLGAPRDWKPEWIYNTIGGALG